MRQARVCLALVFCALSACAASGASARNAGAQTAPARSPGAADSLDPNMVPPDLGSLRQDDITLRVTLTSGLQVRALPLDEGIIRLLSRDSYRSMRELRQSKQKAVDSIANRMRLQSYSLWYVSFYGVAQGESRFSPQEFIIQNVGRDFRPIDILPVTTGFGEQRLKQRDVQSALYVFDGQLDTNQPLVAQMEGTPSSVDWQSVLQRIERERNAVRARASSAKPVIPPARPPPGNN